MTCAPRWFLLHVVAAMMAALTIAAAHAEPHLTPVDDAPLLARDGRVFLAGQPSLSDFDAWAADGVTTVVNMRSRAEIDALPYNPATEAAARGLSYWEIPMGRGDGYDPSQRARLTALLRDTEGATVLYCRTGRRASWAYAAHLVAEDGLTPDAVAALDWPHPPPAARLAQLLGSKDRSPRE